MSARRKTRLWRNLARNWRLATDRRFRRHYFAVRRFFRDHGHVTPAGFERLGPEGVALDLGGFRGDWAAEVRRRYGCRVHVFEAHPGFVEELRARFAADPQVQVHHLALGEHEGTLAISDAGDASSAFEGEGSFEAPMVPASRWLDEQGLARVDAMKINIEGGEYGLLSELIGSGRIADIEEFYVQFHDFVPDAERRRDAIRAALARTHECRWNYDFVWEYWVRRRD